MKKSVSISTNTISFWPYIPEFTNTFQPNTKVADVDVETAEIIEVRWNILVSKL